MIQLSALGNMGMSSSSKTSETEGERSSSFEALLLLTSKIGMEKEKEKTVEPFGLLNQGFLVSSMPQTSMNGPIPNALAVTASGNSTEKSLFQQVTMIVNQTGPLEDAVLQQLGKGQTEKKPIELVGNTDSQDNGPGAQPGEKHILPFEVTSVQIVTKEAVPVEQTGRKPNMPSPSVAENGEELNLQEWPASQQVNQNPPSPIFSSEKAVSADPVRAVQFDKDVSTFIQSAMNLQGGEEGIEATFTLAPKHLGKVDVKVIIQDGSVTAEFFTSTPLGKELLESHANVLRTALEAQGLQVSKIDISQQSISNFMGPFSQKGDSNSRQGQPDSRRRSQQLVVNQEEEYRDYVIDIGRGSKINTTA